MTPPKLSNQVRISQNIAIRLNPKLEKGLLSYAAAASAAGVSLLALTPAAQAKIVYTPAHVQILGNVYLDIAADDDGYQARDLGYGAREQRLKRVETGIERTPLSVCCEGRDQNKSKN